MKFRKKTTATLLIAIFMISTFAFAMVSAETVIYLGSHAVCTSELTTEDAKSGSYSIKLYVDDLADEDQYAEICIEPLAITLSALDTSQTHFWLKVVGDNDYSPYFIFELDDVGTSRRIGTDGDHLGPDSEWFKYEASSPSTQRWWYEDDAPEDWYTSLSALIAGEADLDGTEIIDCVLVQYSAVGAGGTVDATAYIDDVTIDGELYDFDGGVTIVTQVIDEIVSISVDTIYVDFGTIIAGQDSEPYPITVTNTGNVDITVTADIDTQFYKEYLRIDTVPYATDPSTNWDLDPIDVGFSETYDLQLFAVQGAGIHSGSLVFVATPSPP